jgi:hypothetical protein
MVGKLGFGRSDRRLGLWGDKQRHSTIPNEKAVEAFERTLNLVEEPLYLIGGQTHF